jgi:predicted outer membrane lipoprotein
MGHPDVPLEQSQEDIAHHAHEAAEKWILGVALTAALAAALAAITALLAEHHANEAMILQIQSSDEWAHYQAKSIKAGVLDAKAELLLALGKQRAEKDADKRKEYDKEMREINDRAEEKDRESKAHLRHHAVLSRSLTMFQVSIAVGAIAALTRRKWFWFASLVFGGLGLASFVHGILVG